jgi:hypothetical protein
MNDYQKRISAQEKPCIGLFGTCGKSKWRDRFIAKYEELGYDYFNPQVENWDPSMADEEARHLADDEVILFPVTGETYATGSLSEVGFSILQAISLDDRRDFIIMIEMELEEHLKENPTMYQETLRSRALVKQHLKKQRLGNLYVVESLEQMLEVSLVLYENALKRAPLKKFNPHRIIA